MASARQPSGSEKLTRGRSPLKFSKRISHMNGTAISARHFMLAALLLPGNTWYFDN
jgi:hypothetical protein